jgi:hypothetical protein
MHLQRFYCYAMFAPLFVPAIALGLAALVPVVFGLPAVLLAGSLMYTIWSYPPFAVAAIIWMRNRAPAEIERVAWRFPLIYAPLCGIESGVFYGRSFVGGPVTFWSDFFGGVVLAIIYGYAYVAAVRLVASKWPLLARERALAATQNGVVPEGT